MRKNNKDNLKPLMMKLHDKNHKRQPEEDRNLILGGKHSEN